MSKDFITKQYNDVDNTNSLDKYLSLLKYIYIYNIDSHSVLLTENILKTLCKSHPTPREKQITALAEKQRIANCTRNRV